ncbi:NAD(P)H-binding protein [Nonomuraea sp. NPDC050556]|uniref:NAD(P)H-binding protein n=1 Tax=Nonomuraea sp. NPDC050556 TaxID=3364369 RepID=UPI0037941591
MTILVTGATGTVGRIVVDRLLEAGQRVRALTRNPAKAGLPASAEVVRGDFADPASFATAFDGVKRTFFLSGMLDPARAVEQAQAFLAHAAKAGVTRVVDMTGAAVTTRRPGSFEMLHDVEQALEATDLEWTHVRPGEFAINKLDTWGESIRSEDVVRSAFPDAIGVPIHEADIAEVIVAALLEDGHAGQAYTVSGPEALSHREQALAISEGLGRPLRFEPVTYGQARAAYITGGIPMDAAEYILGYQAEYAEEPPAVSPDTARVLGRPGRTMSRWAADHAADLT